MDIVLGVSMTPTTVRMVLVEGEKADGVTVDHDVFDVTPADGSATSNAADQVAAAVLGTQESAAAERSSPEVDRRDVDATIPTPPRCATRWPRAASRTSCSYPTTHAAASLAQAVGRAVGYDTTALLFIEKDTATLSVVQTDDGSVVKVLSRDLHDSDAMAVFTEMAEAVDVRGIAAAGPVRRRLRRRRQLGEGPPGAPGGPAGQRARRARTRAGPRRGARIGARAGVRGVHRRPRLLAGPGRHHRGQRLSGAGRRGHAAGARSVPDAAGLRRAGVFRRVRGRPEPDAFYEDESRKPFLLVGSALTSIFVVGVVALVISLAVSIRPTVDQRPSPGESR